MCFKLNRLPHLYGSRLMQKSSLGSFLRSNVLGPHSRFRRPVVEGLEPRLALAGNLLISTDGPAQQQLFQEYAPTGSLVQSVVIPPGGSSEDEHRRVEHT